MYILEVKAAHTYSLSEHLRGFNLTRLPHIESSPTQLYKIRPQKVCVHQNNFKLFLLSNIKQK